MIVVPAFTEGDEREHPVILAGVGGIKAAVAENVRERVDGERAVPEQRRAQTETPGEQAPAAGQPQSDAEERRRDEVILIEPSELGKLGEVADVVEARVVVTVREDPADVRPPEAEERGRVQIQLLIGEAMMMTVMGSPPEHALLRGRHGQKSQSELKPPAGLKRTVRKIAVVARGDEKHPQLKQNQTGDQVGPVKRHKENGKGQKVNQGERDARKDLQTRPIGHGYR